MNETTNRIKSGNNICFILFEADNFNLLTKKLYYTVYIL